MKTIRFFVVVGLAVLALMLASAEPVSWRNFAGIGGFCLIAGLALWHERRSARLRAARVAYKQWRLAFVQMLNEQSTDEPQPAAQ